ncbi:dual specificity protein phosphatase PHS1 [Amaranthus tricolor]|uniref:dual specificity protein phosphatase PHS1 n=1 Tax=Amaranthus tricolor TaxID=29722 RepID=UPI00258721EC|nr:dual specificity protein phosphatase PHS1 [Amaranthus tricolor]
MTVEEQKQEPIIIPMLQEKEAEDQILNKELTPQSDEPETPLPLTVTSRVLYMLGDLTAGPAYRFTQWLELVRKRTVQYRPSGFPHRPTRISLDMPLSTGESDTDLKDSSPSEQATGINLWERLGKSAMLDIESSSFCWENLSSLHHTEHSGSTEQSDEDMYKTIEVTVNSGGVVFFALFKPVSDDCKLRECAAVIKFSSSRMATQSERLGYEFAKWLGVRIPQARVIHNTSSEWLRIKEAAQKAKSVAASERDEVGEITCSELLEALELSRCLFLMNYVHGSPLLENQNAFRNRDAAEKVASALGRILMLDLVIRNEDRLPCKQLGWRGNSANLLFAYKNATANRDLLEDAYDSAMKRYRPRVVRALQKERRANSVDSRLDPQNNVINSQKSDLSVVMELPIASRLPVADSDLNEMGDSDFNIVAIDSGVPRRPPVGKRVNDQTNYPRLVELLLNSSAYSSVLLYDISGGKLGYSEGDNINDSCSPDSISIVQSFRNGFRGALRDLQGFHMFLLTLNQKLDSVLRSFMMIINRTSSGELDKEDFIVPESPMSAGVSWLSPASQTKEHLANDFNSVSIDSGTASKQSSSGSKDCSDSVSPNARETPQGKYSRWSGEHARCLRLTTKLRDFHKYAKVDAELSKELDQWNETLRNDVVKLCQENNFNTGFFEGSDNNTVVDAYELKVRLEHILERISLISDAANTEKPSLVTNSLFISGALAARSIYTLQHLGITHVLCLCSNELGQSDSQFPELFEYRNFSISDEEDSNISSIFTEACDFIDNVERASGKVLVHCFEGRSRSATTVLAYLMLRKKYTLLEAWNTLKKVHRRAQPNDGFAKILQDLDKTLHGKVSMEWQQRKPTIKACPICGKNVGLSSSSLKLHLQKSHKKLSSGSVDSAMTMEIQKAISAFKISRGGSVSPTQRESPSLLD